MVEKLPQTINLEIVSPDRLVFSGPVNHVSVPGIEGYMGILPGHAPLLSELKIGVISFDEDQADTRLFCSWGFVEVLSDQVSILTESVETAAEIDVEKTETEKNEAEALLRSKAVDTDFEEALIMWQKAVARLEVVKHA